MSLFLQPIPLTIIGIALFLIASIFVGRFPQGAQLAKDAVVYIFVAPLFTIWALNTLFPAIALEFTYWNCVAFGVLNFTAMIVISAGVNGGMHAAFPDVLPTPEIADPEKMQDRMQKIQEELDEGN